MVKFSFKVNYKGRAFYNSKVNYKSTGAKQI